MEWMLASYTNVCHWASFLERGDRETWFGEPRLQEKQVSTWEARTPLHKEAGVRDAVHLTWRGPLLFGGTLGRGDCQCQGAVWEVNMLPLLIDDYALPSARERDRKDTSRTQGRRQQGGPVPFRFFPPSFPPASPATGGQARVCLCRLGAHAGCPGHMARACAACSISTTTTRS